MFAFLFKSKLFELMKAGDSQELSNFLLAHPGLVSVRDRHDNLPLHRAAAADMENFIRLLLSSGARIDAANSTGMTPLQTAMAHWAIASANILIESGAHVRLLDDNGYSTLHYAAVGYNLGKSPRELDVFRLLLEKKAGMEPGSDGMTPLHLSAAGGWVNLVRLLLDRGASPEIRTSQAGTALHQAARSGTRA